MVHISDIKGGSLLQIVSELICKDKAQLQENTLDSLIFRLKHYTIDIYSFRFPLFPIPEDST